MIFSTLHYATWRFVYSEKVLHTDYPCETNDLIAAEIRHVIRNTKDVYQNLNFCTQAEGFQIQSEDRVNLESAAKLIDRYMRRFKHIEWLE